MFLAHESERAVSTTHKSAGDQPVVVVIATDALQFIKTRQELYSGFGIILLDLQISSSILFISADSTHFCFEAVLHVLWFERQMLTDLVTSWHRYGTLKTVGTMRLRRCTVHWVVLRVVGSYRLVIQ